MNQNIKSSNNQVVPSKALEACPKYGFYVFAFTDDGSYKEIGSLRRNNPSKRVFGMITDDGDAAILGLPEIRGQLANLSAREGVKAVATALKNWIDHNSSQDRSDVRGTQACMDRFATTSGRFHKINSIGWGKTFSNIRKWYYTGENPITSGKERTRLRVLAREQAARIAKEQKARRDAIEMQSKQLYHARSSQGIETSLQECINEIAAIYDSVNKNN